MLIIRSNNRPYPEMALYGNTIHVDITVTKADSVQRTIFSKNYRRQPGDHSCGCIGAAEDCPIEHGFRLNKYRRARVRPALTVKHYDAHGTVGCLLPDHNGIFTEEL